MEASKQTLVDLFELDKVAPEKAVEMAGRLSKLVFQAVLVRALPLLSEPDLAEYEKMVDAKENGEIIFKFLGEKVPDFQKIVEEEAELLRKELAREFEKAGV